MPSSPSDYTAGSGTLTFVPGDTSETIGVSVNGDLVAELDEVFDVTLATPSNATLADPTGVGTIIDDELLPVIDIDEPTALEGSGSIVFSASLSHQSASPVTVGWRYRGRNRHERHRLLRHERHRHVRPAGHLRDHRDHGQRGRDVRARRDDGDQPLERTGAPIGDTQGIGTIANDDAAPGLSVGDVSVVEGNTGQKMLTFSVSLTGDTDIDATFDFATAGRLGDAGNRLRRRRWHHDDRRGRHRRHDRRRRER